MMAAWSNEVTSAEGAGPLLFAFVTQSRATADLLLVLIVHLLRDGGPVSP